MNDRLSELSELTKQIQDAVAEIGTILPVIRITNLGDTTCFLLSEEGDIADNFACYFRAPLKNGSDRFNSEVYATLNGIKLHTYSEIRVPAGCEMVCVANPERVAM